MRSHFSTAMTVVGTVVGAGFASGREMQHFFVRVSLLLAMAATMLLSFSHATGRSPGFKKVN